MSTRHTRYSKAFKRLVFTIRSNALVAEIGKSQYQDDIDDYCESDMQNVTLRSALIWICYGFDTRAYFAFAISRSFHRFEFGQSHHN
jgi:hypothetical protein